jgi:hypothetical protein
MESKQGSGLRLSSKKKKLVGKVFIWSHQKTNTNKTTISPRSWR